jgi:peptidoglycan hydrolase-like protein with peptidoglycan-binding domain
MSYNAVGEYYETGLGSYYTFSPHEVYAGFGAFADTFSAQTVWADVQAGSACYETPPRSTNKGACNVAGARATREIQAALNQLGYGPMTVDGQWGSGTQSKWNRYLADNKLSPGPGLGISQQALALMERQLKGGDKPGPGKKVEFEKVNGQLIPKEDTGIAVAGLSGGGLLLAALIVGGIGFAVFKAGKKKKGGMGGKPSTALAKTQPGGTRLATANPRMI